MLFYWSCSSEFCMNFVFAYCVMISTYQIAHLKRSAVFLKMTKSFSLLDISKDWLHWTRSVMGSYQWPFSQKFLQFLVRFLVKNFVREILRAFHKRVRSLFNLKISLTRNSSLATAQTALFSVENYLNWKWTEVFTVRKHITDHSSSVDLSSEINVMQECLKTDVTNTTCVQK